MPSPSPHGMSPVATRSLSELPGYTRNDASVCEPCSVSPSGTKPVIAPPASTSDFHTPPCDDPTHSTSRPCWLSHASADCWLRPLWWCAVEAGSAYAPFPTCVHCEAEPSKIRAVASMRPLPSQGDAAQGECDRGGSGRDGQAPLGGGRCARGDGRDAARVRDR